ncbi:membrane protein [Ruegeria sp. ANG-R]|uniref:membrane protein n=1 Tax=Ruegeria sp. ANG-R TaxID=1577903 RepID=UPI00057F9A38|nr:membrane protein [Ruegeria sp. ANG-R]KIC41143.1 membrane protein [Ruegeria sp. ANG-R]
MVSSTEYGGSESLGVGNIVGESFSILFKNLIAVILLALAPTLLSSLIAGMMVGADVALGVEEPDFSTSSSLANWMLTIILQIVFYALATALLVQLAYDSKLGRPLQLGRYFSPALRAAIPIAILTTISSILAGLASLAFIIPGLWVYAVFSVVAPAVVIEGAGFRGLGRSMALTKGYRWPIFGTLLLIGICAGIVNFLAGIVADMLVEAGNWAMMAGFSVIAAFAAGLTGISIALIYARLREIKEGVSVDQIASVFD